MAESENYRKGAAKRRQLMGDAAVEAASKGVYSDPVMQKFLCAWRCARAGPRTS
jgi:hypothetical protein